MSKSLVDRDLENLWHPYSPLMPERLPLPVVRGDGAYLYLEDGKRIFDGISSWWVNLHGHTHPYLIEALHKQAQTLEHVIFAGFTHEPAVRLGEMLLALWKGEMRRVFFSDNGSTSIETALKMAIQWYALKKEKPDVILALDGAFHGDTFGAMAVSGKSVFNEIFNDYLIPVKHLSFPSDESVLEELDTILKAHSNAIFVYEPLLQGAAGMRVYSPHVLDLILKKIHVAGGICIADEVMTGFGRTGTMFASDQVSEKPDIVCLSKGITGGYMPLAATLANERITSLFSSSDQKRILYHGHSYTANPLACALGIASLELFEKENTFEKIQVINTSNIQAQKQLLSCNSVKRTDVIGSMLAVEFQTENDGYLSSIRDVSYQFFLNRNLLLRPLGNVNYLLPPYCSKEIDLKSAYDALLEFAESI